MAEKPEKAAKDEKPEKGEKGAKPDEPRKEKGKEGKDEGKEGKGKDKGPPAKPTWKSDNPDFKYIVRIANTDLTGQQPVEIALAAVRGIGIRTAGVVSDLTGINRYERIGNLNDEQVQKLEGAVLAFAETVPPWLLNRARDMDSGVDMHIVSSDVDIKVRDDLNRMKKIRSYKGIRHEDGQKVRGQRTRANGRTGLTVGVQRKAIAQAQAAKKEEEGGRKEAKPAAGAAKPAAAGAAKPAAGGAAKPAGGAKPAEKK